MRINGLEGVLVVLLSLGRSVAQEGVHDEFDRYVTEPTIRSNKVTVVNSVQDRSLLEAGYIFFAPFPSQNIPVNGPQIVDQSGDLIWFGNASTRYRVQDFSVCNYKEQDASHLCWSEGYWTDMNNIGGSNRIFDNTYTQVGRDYVSTKPMQDPNPHEFNTVSNGNSFLQTVFEAKPRDLTFFGGPQDGYVYDGCFQEVDVETGEATFTWCGLDHLELWHSYVYFVKAVNDTGEHYGLGSATSPWDYFHINAVDKNEEGDYFVSARHLDQILKVAGNDNVHGVAPGTVLWKLGGQLDQFGSSEVLDISRQHHIRHHETTATETIISIFNNQWLQFDGNYGISNAQVITINNETNSVSSVRKYYNPDGLLSLAQGSAQVLPNGNIFVGWGTVPHVSEFNADGTLLYHAHLANYTLDGTGQCNYRAFKSPWIGKPSWNPKIIAYSRTCRDASSSASATSSADPLIAYVSWNGATEVRYWRFRTSQTSLQGPWLSAGTFPRAGFETKAQLRDTFARFVEVEALDENHHALGRAAVETFVPDDAKLNGSCGANGCFLDNGDDGETGFVYGPDMNAAGSCVIVDAAAYDMTVVALIVVCCMVVCITLLQWRFIFAFITGRRREREQTIYYIPVAEIDTEKSVLVH